MKIHISHELTAQERRALEVHCKNGDIMTKGELTAAVEQMVFNALHLVCLPIPRRVPVKAASYSQLMTAARKARRKS